ncbi:GroES-like protein [Laetiporus sulphureus 93-53]|uniref:GroES-like protein n=1 Tax=Laetiporus sulphureus 93-53 TaxID=1314785 RepID=A0A165BFH8_9APHY|nr:GroES-like protein [Laetiporus sulphureus 93-53]KZT00945.1 GroES-like protein [Laetiporus sulphureus 93-53]
MSAILPTTQKALLLTAKQGTFALKTIPIHTPGSGELLLKVQAVALNPVDWKIRANGIIVRDYPAVLGMDISGTVEVVGGDVHGFERGDRVVTQGFLTNTHAGFQQYTLANADITAKIPEKLSFDAAASIPTGLVTAALGLYTSVIPAGVDYGSAGLHPPWEEGGRGKYAGTPIIVLGASGSVGQFALQLARLSGFSPILATASLYPETVSNLHTLGATHILDRRLPLSALRDAIAQVTSAEFPVVFDGASLPETQALGYELLAPGGCLVTVLYPQVGQNERAQDGKRVVKAFGQANFPPENREIGRKLFGHLTAFLQEGIINRVELLSLGLEGVETGLERMRKGEMSGVKLVTRPQETE